MGPAAAGSAEGKASALSFDILAEDRMRADAYALLAVLLRHEPDDTLLDNLAVALHDGTEFGEAVGELAAAASAHTADAVADEFYALFVGVGESELKPYASYYLTGFMYEKPLANLRSALADFGIAKSDDTVEPEDHIAALCETMCALIMGEFGPPVSLSEQKRFFETHIRSWAVLFFRDLEQSPSADFYRAVGRLGQLFMQIETQAFEMVE